MSLAKRMKQYEGQQGSHLMWSLPALIRIDGRAFHTFCKKLDKPLDIRLSQCMIDTMRHLMQKTSAIAGYTQFDEISLLLYNNLPNGQIYFNGKVQKILSVLTSETTPYFLKKVSENLPEVFENIWKNENFPTFDCRCHNVPSISEAVNYFKWREQDCTRNSISAFARKHYSHAQLHRKNTTQVHDMLYAKGLNWNNLETWKKRGYSQHKNGQILWSFCLESHDDSIKWILDETSQG